MMPVDAVIAVTFRCNARCQMCGIWKTKEGQELPPKFYSRLPATLKNINITGGEPFLRDDLVALHLIMREFCPKAQTIISTNGFLTDRIVSYSREMAKVEPNIGLAISIDGPEVLHDRLRGTPNGYARAIRTVRELQQAGIDNVRLAYTATAHNLEGLEHVYELSRQMKTEFTCAVQHSSEHYFHTVEPPEHLKLARLAHQLEPIIRSELATWSPKRWARAYFMNGQLSFLKNKRRPLPCHAGVDSFFLDTAGDVFTCNAIPWKMGNLASQSFDLIWNSSEAKTMREKVQRCSTGCWMVCSARTAMRRSLPKVFGWALKNKFFYG